MTIEIKKIQQPPLDHSGQSILLSDQTIDQRLEKILKKMKAYGFSSLVIYGDKEHGSNFEYLTGFIPRFEEGLLSLNQDGRSTLVLGNENYNKVGMARIKSQGIKCPFFSLPNQPMDFSLSLKDYLSQVELDQSGRVGLVGWKLLAEDQADYAQVFDVPAFIVAALKELVGADNLFNATHLFVDPKIGVRIQNNANEIARYEYGASLASDGLLNALNHLQIGQQETAAGEHLTKAGQFPSVVTIAAFGQRFEKANLYPTEKTLAFGDKVALTVAYKGGLSSRGGYAVNNQEELEAVAPNYLKEVVKPYFKAYHFWLKNLTIGKNGGEFFAAFNQFYPQKDFGWELCPGHLVADEEWLASPFFPNSPAMIQSGMIFQIDFIPIQTGFNGISAESTVAIADLTLRQEIQAVYPALWLRIEARRRYLIEELNFDLSEEILPLCSTVGYLRPYLLNDAEVLVRRE